MNRFEQTRTPINRKMFVLIPIVVFLIILFLFLQGIQSVSDTTLAKQQENLELSIARSITQCYAVEGSYPPFLEYLSTHYGLVYDAEHFQIDYSYSGNNVLPTVKVNRKELP